MATLDRVPGPDNLYIGGCVYASTSPNQASPPPRPQHPAEPSFNLSDSRALSTSRRIFSLRRKEAFAQANITHVVSVLRLPLDDALFAKYKHLVVEVDDVEDENLLEHFAATNAFIREGLDGGGGVLVHWSVGGLDGFLSSGILMCLLVLSMFPPPLSVLQPHPTSIHQHVNLPLPPPSVLPPLSKPPN